MKKALLPLLPVIVVAILIAAKGSFFIVNEGEQAIITQFGKPVGQPITDSGLHFKTPFTQKARYLDKRILTWDGQPNQIPTKDKKYIKVDTTARWLIVDALKFIQTVENERGAEARLGAILDAATRDVISNHRLVEVVRNTDSIIEEIAAKKKKAKEDAAKGLPTIEEEVTGEISSIKVGRERLSEIIVENASHELTQLGIKLIDLQLRRISYEQTVEAKVYERMISERQRIAQKIRSIGQGEKAKIEGRLKLDLQRITSEAYKTAEIIKGKADAKSTLIYARAYNQGAGFYEFQRTLEAYRKSLKGETQFILSSDSKFLKLFK